MRVRPAMLLQDQKDPNDNTTYPEEVPTVRFALATSISSDAAPSFLICEYDAVA